MMTVIDQPITPQKVKEALEKTQAKKNKKSLRKHFGKLKRGLDAVSHQKKLRDNWA